MLTSVDKMKINKYLREHALGDIYYMDMCEAIGKVNKVSDIEFLNYFVDYAVTELSKTSKISMKNLSKIVSVIISFLDWIHSDKIEIDNKVLDKIRSLKEYYDEYLKNSGLDYDSDFVDNFLNVLLEKVNSLYSIDSNSESVVIYLKEIDDLNSQLSLLRKELEQYKDKYERLSKEYDRKGKSLVDSNNNLNNANNLIISKDKKISELGILISSLEEKISILESQLDNAKKDNEELLPFKKKYEELVLIVSELKECICKYETHEKQREEQKKLYDVLNVFIYKSLLDKSRTLDELVELLKSNGYVVTKDDVLNVIREMKRTINIVKNSMSIKPRYYIATPNVVKNGKFNIEIPEGCKCYDILLVSDIHMRELSSRVKNRLTKVRDYCLENNISLVLNLGDFFDGCWRSGNRIEDALLNVKCVKDAVSILPYDESIYYAVLGGNHDEKLFSYGIDPLGIIAGEREDYIDLGYEHCTITFNGNCSVLSSFSIHHPLNFDYPIDLGDNGMDSSGLLKELDEFYSKQGRTRTDSYIDILGHMHKSLFDFSESYCFLPAYNNSNTYSGVCHLKVFFDDESNIKSMAFILLDCDHKLTKKSEIIYKKVLSKS